MKEHGSPGRRIAAVAAAAVLGLGAAGCERTTAEPTAAAAGAPVAQIGGAGAQTVDLIPLPPGNAQGTSTLRRRHGGFTFRIAVHGLQPGHAVTAWAMNPGSDAGLAASGIVGAAGTMTLAGNNCVHAGGKSPGTPPDCNLVDPADVIRILILQSEEPWEPGDQSTRWTPAGKPPSAEAIHPAD